MNSRERILNEIKSGAAIKNEICISKVDGITYQNTKKQFSEVLTMIGGKVMEVQNESEIETYLTEQISLGKKVVNVLAQQTIDISKEELYKTDIAILKGGVAVAENACIWITEKNMGNRILPFSCEQLIVVIETKNIVNNMHEAYSQISIAKDGYGVFIAGPSKTADIEQSLVIGAHGPVSFLVFILN